MAIDVIFTDSQTVVLDTPYARIIRIADAKVWNVNTGELASDTPYAQSVLTLGDKDNVVVGWRMSLPHTLPSGEYLVLIYNGTATASEADIPVRKSVVRWAGSKIAGTPFTY